MAKINTSKMPHTVTIHTQSTSTYNAVGGTNVTLYVKGVDVLFELIDTIKRYKGGVVAGITSFTEKIVIPTQGFSIGEETAQDFGHLRAFVTAITGTANKYKWITAVDAPFLHAESGVAAASYWTDVLPVKIAITEWAQDADYDKGIHGLSITCEVSA